jgi:hypothetical protein
MEMCRCNCQSRAGIGCRCGPGFDNVSAQIAAISSGIGLSAGAKQTAGNVLPDFCHFLSYRNVGFPVGFG